MGNAEHRVVDTFAFQARDDLVAAAGRRIEVPDILRHGSAPYLTVMVPHSSKPSIPRASCAPAREGPVGLLGEDAVAG
ncbi:hypothetical protein ABZ379_27980, partial [Streptomyces canus]|uniref:hypothetical protein n=1 Tax=Streptomyces canus TaxID=58343 RepID=UPI00340CDCAE